MGPEQRRVSSSTAGVMEANAFEALPLVPYLVGPRSVTEHLRTLETGRFTLSCECSSFWEKFHVYALTQVNQCQAGR